MKLFLFSLILVMPIAHGKTSIYDLLQEKREVEIGGNIDCRKDILTIPRKNLDLSHKFKIQKVKDLNIGHQFYHYSNALVLYDLLKGENRNRKDAHELIVQDGGYSEILKHSLKSIGAAGGGIYVAGNPFSSKRYGDIQLRYDISENANVITDTGPMDIVDSFNLENISLASCPKNLLSSLIYQESGIDLILYRPDKDQWMLLLNDDVIKSSDVNKNIELYQDISLSLARQHQFDEIMSEPKLIDSFSTLSDADKKESLRILLSSSRPDIIDAMLESYLLTKWPGKDAFIQEELLNPSLNELETEFASVICDKDNKSEYRKFLKNSGKSAFNKFKKNHCTR